MSATDAHDPIAKPEPAHRDVKPSNILRPGSTWTGPDGTVYDVVRPEEVGERPRWWVRRYLVKNYERAAAVGFGGVPWPPGPDWPCSLHRQEPFADADDIAFALVLNGSTSDLRTSLRSILGLPAGADDEAVRAAVEQMRDGWSATSKAFDAIRDRVVTVADDAFGLFPVQTADEALTAIERAAAKPHAARENLTGRLLLLASDCFERTCATADEAIEVVRAGVVKMREERDRAQSDLEAARERNADQFAAIEELRYKLAAADRAGAAARDERDMLREDIARLRAESGGDRAEERERLDDLAKDLGVPATGTAFDVIVRIAGAVYALRGAKIVAERREQKAERGRLDAKLALANLRAAAKRKVKAKKPANAKRKGGR